MPTVGGYGYRIRVTSRTAEMRVAPLLTGGGFLSVNITHREAAHSIGSAPRHDRLQGWRHRTMRKGFVSEKELKPRARDLRTCVSI